MGALTSSTSRISTASSIRPSARATAAATAFVGQPALTAAQALLQGAKRLRVPGSLCCGWGRSAHRGCHRTPASADELQQVLPLAALLEGPALAVREGLAADGGEGAD